MKYDYIVKEKASKKNTYHKKLYNARFPTVLSNIAIWINNYIISIFFIKRQAKHGDTRKKDKKNSEKIHASPPKTFQAFILLNIYRIRINYEMRRRLLNHTVLRCCSNIFGFSFGGALGKYKFTAVLILEVENFLGSRRSTGRGAVQS